MMLDCPVAVETLGLRELGQSHLACDQIFICLSPLVVLKNSQQPEMHACLPIRDGSFYPGRRDEKGPFSGRDVRLRSVYAFPVQQIPEMRYSIHGRNEPRFRRNPNE